jgi:cation:H+ antiporter
VVWLKLIVCILIIFFAGKRVAKYGDIIAEGTGIGRVWMGVIAIALVTSLPELFTGISAVTLVGEPDLAVGDLIGANSFNLLNLALLDLYHKHGSIFLGASATHRVTAWFSLLLLSLVALSIIISSSMSSMSLGWIGWYTPVIIIMYVISVRQICQYERRHKQAAEPILYPADEPLRKTIIYFIISSVFIIGAGIWLATIGDEIASVTGWEKSFVGSLFLAFTTTLPEITVSFTAIRIGATDMAIANMVGSNLFNLTIIPVADIIYGKGPIFAHVSAGHLVIAGAVAVMTLLFILGLRVSPPRVFRLSWLNCSLIIIFILGTYLSFILS